MKLSNDSAREMVHEINDGHYLKPIALIVPGTFLIYSGLKSFIDAIPKLDNKIMVNIRETYPDFHTNAADYLMWASIHNRYV